MEQRIGRYRSGQGSWDEGAALVKELATHGLEASKGSLALGAGVGKG